MQITSNMIPTAVSAASPMAMTGGEAMQGGFMDIIAQLLSTCGDLALDLSAVDALKSRLEEESQELSAQMLAQLMANPLMLGFGVPTQEEALSTAAGSPQLDWSALQAAISTTATDPVAEGVEGEVLSHIVGRQAPKAETEQSLLAQGRFQSALIEAKGKSQAAEPLHAEALDIDRLQEEIKSGRFNLMQHTTASGVQAAEAPAAEQVEAAPLLEQVAEGITQQLGSGKQEFVVKLRPEGLGEITVKLAEVGSKIALTITTSSEQTGRMLSAEIGALKEALRPYNADVQEVVSSSQASSFLFSEGDRGNFARQQAFNRQQSRESRHSAAFDPSIEAISTPTPEQSTALDVHI